MKLTNLSSVLVLLVFFVHVSLSCVICAVIRDEFNQTAKHEKRLTESTGDSCCNFASCPQTGWFSNNVACSNVACVGSCCYVTYVDGVCNDGDACTTGDSCVGGMCSGNPITCNDNNPCTTDSCDPGVGCVYTPRTGSACDDSNPCTTGDVCNSGGQCVGNVINCNDNNACTDDSCSGGTCFNLPNNRPCNDGNACTIGDTCSGGSCASGALRTCNDNNVCTTDSCNTQTGACSNVFNTIACNDGLPCTSNDQCLNGVCSGVNTCNDNNICTNNVCSATGCVYPFDNSVPCNDNDPCTSPDFCTNGVCSGTRTCTCGSAADCNDGNDCTLDACNSGSCSHTPQTGTSCQDGNPCNGADTCSNGVCSVHAGNPCAGQGTCRGTCVPSGLTYTCADPIGTPCDDGVYCNGRDRCDGLGTCVHTGSPCANGTVCNNVCNEATQDCFALNGTSCQDNIFCNGIERCNGRGLCLQAPASEYPCPAFEPCRSSCNETTKSCFSAKGVSCDDQLWCTGREECDGFGTCLHLDLPCSIPCQNQCDEFSRTCSLSPVNAPCTDDGLWCTGREFCDGNGTCVNSGNPCESICPEACQESQQKCSASACSDAVKQKGASTTTIYAIVGIVGGLVIIAIVVLLIFLLVRRRKNEHSRGHDDVKLETIPNIPGRTESTAYLPLPATALAIENNSQSLGLKNSSWEIRYGELKFGEELGSGAYGRVMVGKWRNGDVAIKQIKGDLGERQIADFLGEIAIMTRLRPHANVVSFMGVCLNPLCLVTELMKGGSLDRYLADSSKIIKENQILLWMSQIAGGMNHLSSEGVVHRDLAARNILLTEDLAAKISDFGMSRVAETTGNTTKSNVGPLKFMAPECISHRTYSSQSDVWSYGITVIEILTRREPYPNMDALQVATKVSYERMTHPLPPKLHSSIVQLLTLCFAYEPRSRPTFQQIIDMLYNQTKVYSYNN